MIGAVHAAVGAGVGSLCKNKSAAFVAGIVSHLIADAAPHKDFSMKIELPLVAGAMLAMGLWRGLDSPEFWGALGGIAPDIEHGLLVAGVIEMEDEVFPTHAENGKLHGAETNERWSQLLIAAASVLTIALTTRRGDSDC